MSNARERLERYRPATLARLWRALDSSPTALVLLGPRGSGLEELVVLGAQHLVCPDGGCGVCGACKAIEEGAHPEVRILSSTPSVEDIRGLVEHARHSAERWRVAGLVGVERVASVAPIVLKAIEEPSDRGRWLLAGSAVPTELAALVSRCVRVPVEAPPAAEVTEVLTARGVELGDPLSELVPSDLELLRALEALEDPRGWLEGWRCLPTLLERERPSLVAARLRPPSTVPLGQQEVLVRLGLAVLVRAHATELRWGRAASRASRSLARRVSVPLVLAELVTNVG